MHPLDQLGIIVLHVADPRPDHVRCHDLGREGAEQRLQSV
jgi:hypothetical protein